MYLIIIVPLRIEIEERLVFQIERISEDWSQAFRSQFISENSMILKFLFGL